MKSIALAFLLCVIVVSGCTGNPSSQCTEDADCGETICTDSMTAISTPTCVNGACLTNTADCELNQLCVQDSGGVQCQNKTEQNLPKLSCSMNAATLKATGTNPYNPATFMCQDDCPQGTFCDAASCACDDKKKISCYEYTDATTNPFSGFLGSTITELFDPAKQTCSADCPEGYTCKTATCLCELTPQKCTLAAPKFYSNYFPDSPKPDIDSLFDVFVGGGDLSSFGPVIRIPAFESVEGGTHYVPFPREQMEIHPPDDPMVVIGGYCANEYFVGAQAIDIDGNMLTEPSGENDFCKWGGVIPHEGVLEMCTEDLTNWLIIVAEKGSLF